MKNCLLVLLLFFSFFSLPAQDKWMHYTTADGLPDDQINDVYIEDSNRVWLATNFGLSLFDGSSFFNYFPSFSQAQPNQIKELIMANGSVFMLTGAGLSELNSNGTLINYSTANGLLSNVLTGLAVDDSSQLWIASTSGVSKFDGSNFTHFPSKRAFDIAVDSNNRVYILRFPAVFNSPGSTQNIYEVFDGNTWSSPALGGFSENFGQAKIKRTRSGEMLILSGADPFYAKLSYPFNLEIVRPQINGIKILSYQDLEIDEQQRSWISVNHGLNYSGLYSGADSAFQSLNLDRFNLTHFAVDIHDGMVVSGSSNGIFVASRSIPSSKNLYEIEVNSIRTGIDANGILLTGVDLQQPGFEFPKGNLTGGIYSANLIVATKSAGDLSPAVNPMSPFLKQMQVGPFAEGTILSGKYIVKVSRSEIDLHKLNYQSTGYRMPEGIQNWPANGDTSLGMALDLAPFFDLNNNGCYDPQNGDYPAILGDEAIYWINTPRENDKKLEYHGMLYGYNSTNPALNQSLFLKYRIINRSNQLIDTVQAGFFMDADVGAPFDDYIGCDSIHNIAYAYNADSIDPGFGGQNNYGNNPPAVGLKFLSDSMWSHMMLTQNSSHGQVFFPHSWVNLMNGRWTNGFPAKFGGNGYNSAGTTSSSSRYMYTGNPFLNSGWTEKTPGNGVPENTPGDRRSLSSIPSFSLAPGADKVIDLVVAYGMKDSIQGFAENVPELIRILNLAKAEYDNFNYSGFVYADNSGCVVIGLEEAEAGIVPISMYPNPSDGQLRFESETGIQQIEVYNMNGSQLRMATYHNQKQLDFSFPEQVKGGLYLIRVLDAKNKWHAEKVILQR